MGWGPEGPNPLLLGSWGSLLAVPISKPYLHILDFSISERAVPFGRLPLIAPWPHSKFISTTTLPNFLSLCISICFDICSHFLANNNHFDHKNSFKKIVFMRNFYYYYYHLVGGDVMWPSIFHHIIRQSIRNYVQLLQRVKISHVNKKLAWNMVYIPCALNFKHI